MDISKRNHSGKFGQFLALSLLHFFQIMILIVYILRVLGGMGMGGGSLGGLSALMGGRPGSAQSTDSNP